MMRAKQLKFLLSVVSFSGSGKRKSEENDALFLKDGFLLYFGLDWFVKFKFLHQVQGSISFFKFKKFVQSFHGQEMVELIDQGNQVALASNGKVVGFLPFAEPCQINEDSEEYSKPVGVFSYGLIRALEEASHFTGSDEFRPSLSYVALDNHVAATDGHILFYRQIGKSYSQHSFPVPYSNQSSRSELGDWLPEGEPLLISRTSIQYLARLGMEVETSLVYFKSQTEPKQRRKWDGKFLRFEVQGIQFFQKCFDERYPKWRNAVPDQIEHEYQSFLVEKADLMAGIKSAALQASVVTKAVRLMLTHDQVEISSKDPEFGSIFHKAIPCLPLGMELPVCIPGIESSELILGSEPLVIGFNAELLLKVLRKQNLPHVLVQAKSPTQAVIINREYLIMPLILRA